VVHTHPPDLFAMIEGHAGAVYAIPAAYTAGMKKRDTTSSATPFDAFKELAGKLVRVPKAEHDKQEAAYQRAQKKKPKRGPKSSG
jgi:hypothetical protein